MQLQQVKHKNGGKFILIENHSQLLDYIKIIDSKLKEFISYVIKHNLPVDRLSHYANRGLISSFIIHAHHICMIGNVDYNNPLVQLDILYNDRIKKFESILNDNKIIFLNEVGGYFYGIHDDIESYAENYTRDYIVYKINKNTKYLNLENDWVLEEHTKDYMEGKDKNFSYILNLKELSDSELISILDEFYKAGGQSIYVYTTGTNVEQMYNYTHCILESSYNNNVKPKIIFEFNSGMTKGIKDYLNHFKDKLNINYSLV